MAIVGHAARLLLVCLAVASAVKYVPMPNLTDTTHMHVEVGDTETLTCWVEVEFQQGFDITIDYPAQSGDNSGHVVCRNSTISIDVIKIGKVECKLQSVTHADEGNYTCRVNFGDGKENSRSRYLKVYERGTTYLNLSLNIDENYIEVLAEEEKYEAVITVYIKAHPEVESIEWFRGRNAKILTTERSVIQNDEHKTMLSLHNLTVRDSGNYRVEARNKFNRSNLTFYLLVLDKPTVTVQTKEPYLYNLTHEINCTVAGYPPSNITWYGRFCGLRTQCDGVFTKYDDTHYSISTISDFEQVSTLKVTGLESGQVACAADNLMGTGSSVPADVVITDTPYVDKIWLSINDETHNASYQPVEEDVVKMTCGVPVASYKSGVRWYKGGDGVMNTTEHAVSIANTKFSYRASVEFPKISKKNEGVYTCNWTTLDGSRNITFLHLKVQALQKPFFTETNMNITELNVPREKGVNLTCYIDGSPKPKITWYKDGNYLQKDANSTNHILLHEENFTLTIMYARESDEGEYTCKGYNKVGQIERFVSLMITGKRSSTGLTAGIVILLIILLASLVILIYKIREAQKIKRELVATGLNHFKEGAMENFNPDLPIDEQAELLPYDKKWEFPRDRLKMGRQLGAGAFGVVRRAEAWSIVEGESVTTVAVKSVKSADYAYIKALASELKIMLHLGKHLNVVNLLGACTEELNKREFLVIVEFCRYGNLQNFLMRHRELFIDQLDPETGKIDFSKGEDLIKAIASRRSCRSRFKNASWKLMRGDSNLSTRSEKNEEDHYSPEPQSPAVNSDMSVSMSPGGNEDYPMMSNNSIQPGWRSNFHGDYKIGLVDPIFTKDLLCWAFQVARGMEYLSSRKVMHGDLAARNILLADDNVVKICDFGLAKSMYKSDNYKKKGEGPLPVKWMAIEAIRDRVFSIQSDVWSYGVVLWEIFSLARTPYPGMEADEKLFNNLTGGYRMECPQYATREIYQLMLDCWEVKPTTRPTFTRLGEQLGAMLEESVREHYVDLNDPYVAMNQQVSEDHSDYLGGMVAPTYENLMSPTYEKPEPDYVNNPKAARQQCLDAATGSGYMRMNNSAGQDLMIFSPRDADAATGSIFTFATTQPVKRRLAEASPPPTAGDFKQSVERAKETSIADDQKPPGPTANGAVGFSNPNYVGPVKPLRNIQQENGTETNKTSPHDVQSPNANYLFMGNHTNKV